MLPGGSRAIYLHGLAKQIPGLELCFIIYRSCSTAHDGSYMIYMTYMTYMTYMIYMIYII